jgi:hypothetical protein
MKEVEIEQEILRLRSSDYFANKPLPCLIPEEKNFFVYTQGFNLNRTPRAYYNLYSISNAASNQVSNNPLMSLGEKPLRIGEFNHLARQVKKIEN